MYFKDLQEQLRRKLYERYEKGEFTGLGLAEEVGFQQAHISNFLNGKRALSLPGLDKVMKVKKISILDLLDPAEVNKRASIFPPSDDDFENVPVAEGEVAAGLPHITKEKIKDVLKFKKNFLKRLKAEMEADRSGWQRFVLVKVDSREGMAMYPRLLPGATVLIDRHYNGLKEYRKGERNLYAVKKDGGVTIRYVELAGNNLVLRPHNESYPIDVMAIEEGKTAAEMIVGRVCHVAVEA